MTASPFLDDPGEQFARQIALAVASPIEDVRAMHLRAAEHFAALAKASRLPLPRSK
ncbi:hypothetical protein [Sphingomonas mollis]|uniref:Uncharacterized protein n=1 Tax=Sphingomonas mollis TaxID=2795726 RepID=A0ABS0XU69_9SPHN|nr:hypothetical protein [Sphingomonas sp. BT553]MBJ6123275.1 hypothetical protein [Sphingomonas sp. BT553]